MDPTKLSSDIHIMCMYIITYAHAKNVKIKVALHQKTVTKRFLGKGK